MKFLIVFVFFVIACATGIPMPGMSEHFSLLTNIGPVMRKQNLIYKNEHNLNGNPATTLPPIRAQQAPTAVPKRARRPSTEIKNSLLFGTGALITKWAKRL